MLVEVTEDQVPQRNRCVATSAIPAICCLMLTVLLSGGSLGAQAAESLAVGARIRVLARDSTKRSDGERQFVARYDGVERDSLAIRFFPESDRFLFPLSGIRSIDLSVSHRSAGRGAWIGAGYGALLGASVTAVFLVGPSGPSSDGWLSPAAGALITGVPLTALSTAIGAIVFSRRQDKWRRVPLDSLRTSR